MTDTRLYRNVSLLHKTWDKLKFISQNIIANNSLSLSKTVTVLVNDKYQELKSALRKSLDLLYEMGKISYLLQRDVKRTKVKQKVNIERKEEETKNGNKQSSMDRTITIQK